MLLRRNRYINNLKENILETRVEGKEAVGAPAKRMSFVVIAESEVGAENESSIGKECREFVDGLKRRTL